MAETKHSEIVTEPVEKGTLLIPQQFSSYPDQLDELGLSLTAIVLAQRMLKHIRRAEAAVFNASQVELACLVGVTKKTAARAVDELQACGVVAVQRRTNGRSCYIFRPVEQWVAGSRKPVAVESSPATSYQLPATTHGGVKIPPPWGKNYPATPEDAGENLPQDGVKIPPPWGKNSPAVLNSTRARHCSTATEYKTPLPPEGGSVCVELTSPCGGSLDGELAPPCAESLCGELTEESGAGSGEREAGLVTTKPKAGLVTTKPKAKTEAVEEKSAIEEILARVDAAHRVAHNGVGMPANWSAKIEKECTEGDPAIFQYVDAEVIRKGYAKAVSKGKSQGIGWVLIAAREKAAATPIKSEPEAAKYPIDPAVDAHRHAQQRDALRKAIETRRVAWFRSLPAETQQRYIALAGEKWQKFSLAKKPEFRERMAAHLAREDEKSQEAVA